MSPFLLLTPSYPLHNVFNKRTTFLKILGSFLRFMFTNFLLNAFSFIDNCFQMLSVKIAPVSRVTYIKFLNEDYMIS